MFYKTLTILLKGLLTDYKVVSVRIQLNKKNTHTQTKHKTGILFYTTNKHTSYRIYLFSDSQILFICCA